MVSMLLIMVSCVPLADALHISRHDVAMPAGSWVCPDEPLAPQYTPTLFVATDGNDGNDGRSLGRPLRTLQRAADLAQPGDVIWVRGGTYTNPVHFRRSGTSSAPIVIESHPGECAILDGSHLSSGRPVTFASVQHLHFRNFVVRNSPTEGIYLDRSHDNRVTNVRTHHHYWSGITVAASNRNLFAYFISHDNFDPPAGGHADGINVNTGDRNHIDRCIVYNNSDDGVDTWRSTRTLVERCIAFDNGWQGGDGNGIKAGGGNDAYTIVRNSIAFNNKTNGFDHNAGRYVTFLNNTAYANGRYNFVTDETSVLYNNVSQGRANSLWGATNSHNSWNLGIDPAFVSTDSNSTEFLRLPAGSAAIQAGTDVGLPYTGNAPDLGAIPHELRYLDVIGTTIPTAMTSSLAQWP
jgi:parallel beta-helix repeat protein